MARKKKKEIIVVENSNIKYEGTVTVKKVKNGKILSTNTFHNEGGSSLFNFLLYCLAGQWLPNMRPRYVVAANNNEFIGAPINQIGSIQVYPGTNDTDAGYIEYRFFMPYREEYQLGFNQLVLYCSDEAPDETNIGVRVQGYSMIVTATDNQFIATQDEDLLIIWQLKVSNPQSATPAAAASADESIENNEN